MKTRKPHTTVTRPRKSHRTVRLLAALAALTLAGTGTTEARTLATESTAHVNVLNREEIEIVPNTMRNLNDLANLTPGIVTDTYAGGAYGSHATGNNMNIRGLGNGPRYDNTMIDGVPYNPNGGYNTTFGLPQDEIQRFEVLRGPQGTLYGRDSIGGSLNLNPKRDLNPDLGQASNGNIGHLTNTGYTVGNKFDTLSLGAGLRYQPIDTTSMLNTGDAGLNTTLNTGITYEPTADSTPTVGVNPTLNTDTTGGTPASTPCPKSGTAANTGGKTVQSNPRPDSWRGYNIYDNSYGGPCERVQIDWDKVRSQFANDYRIGASHTAQSLISRSQPNEFIDFSYHNTAADELATRTLIGSQMTGNSGISGCYAGQGYDFGPGGYPDPRKPYVGGNEAPKVYYRVGADYPTIPIGNDSTGSAATASDLPPVPEYKPTVNPLDASELSDEWLRIEIEHGPSMVKHYLDKAADEREQARRDAERADQWRAQAQQARDSAAEARDKATNARNDESRRFWGDQARSYEEHADILEDAAKAMDHSAANANAVADAHEADARQRAENLSRAVGEQVNRTTRAATQAATDQAAREAEAKRVEAERQQRLNDLIRNSNTGSPNNSGSTTTTEGTSNPQRPDMREPQIGKEARNETIRKLLD